jgi:hypothetical protein
VGVETSGRYQTLPVPFLHSKADGITLLADLAERAGAPDAVGLAKELALIMEGALITHQVDPDCDVCIIARPIAETLLDKHLPASA